MLDASNLFNSFFGIPTLHCFFFKKLFLLLVCNLLLRNDIVRISVCYFVHRSKDLQHETSIIALVGDLNEDPGQQPKAECIPVVK